MELHESPLCIGPEGFDSVDMTSAVCKFILPMMDTIMLFVSQINQSAISTPGVRMDHAVGIDSAANDGLERLPGTIGHDLGVDMTSSLENAKHRGFPIGATSSFPFHTPCAKIRFVNFNLTSEGRRLLTEGSDPFPDLMQIAVDGVPVQPGQNTDFLSVQIQGKVPRQLPKFGLRNS